MESEIRSIVDALRKQRQRLSEQHEIAVRTVHHLEVELDKISRAVAALRGEKASRSKRKRSDTLNGTQVTNILEQVLRTEGPLSEANLKNRVVEHVVSEGKSKLGLHLVLHKMLRKDQFYLQDDCWSLNR